MGGNFFLHLSRSEAGVRTFRRLSISLATIATLATALIISMKGPAFGQELSHTRNWIAELGHSGTIVPGDVDGQITLGAQPSADAFFMSHPDLTGAPWDVRGSDGRSHWNLSSMVFTQQIRGAGTDDLTGYFDWVGSDGQSGREYFRGTLAGENLQLQGYRVENVNRIASASYRARVVGGGGITNGFWTGYLPGVWSAIRMAPPPVTQTPRPSYSAAEIRGWAMYDSVDADRLLSYMTGTGMRRFRLVFRV